VGYGGVQGAEHEVPFMKGEEGEWVMEVFRVLRVSEWMC
jgi:hypothetical protein